MSVYNRAKYQLHAWTVMPGRVSTHLISAWSALESHTPPDMNIWLEPYVGPERSPLNQIILWFCDQAETLPL